MLTRCENAIMRTGNVVITLILFSYNYFQYYMLVLVCLHSCKLLYVAICVEIDEIYELWNMVVQ